MKTVSVQIEISDCNDCPHIQKVVAMERLLKMAMVAQGVHLVDLASDLGLSRWSVWRRLKGLTQWRGGELEVVAERLGVLEVPS